MAEYSPYPWKECKFGSGIEDTNGKMVILGMCGGDQDSLDAADEHDIKRIIACVNACEGIPTEELEKHGITCR